MHMQFSEDWVILICYSDVLSFNSEIYWQIFKKFFDSYHYGDVNIIDCFNITALNTKCNLFHNIFMYHHDVGNEL